MKLVLVIASVLLFPLPGSAQDKSRVPADPVRVPNPRRSVQDPQIDLPDEMRIKLAIERAEGEHRKILEDVKKLSDLSTEVTKHYDDKKAFSSDDAKKMDAIEKLAKRILSNAGGNEVAEDPANRRVNSASEALEKLGAAVTAIKNNMLDGTRFVVSATVVANSNAVIHLAKFLKQFRK